MGAPEGPSTRRVTIYDVAKEAGVSPSTVSRAFARPGRVSSETGAHIRAVADRLGYRQEEIFRPAATHRHSIIGLAVSDITNPFYFGVIRGAERAAAEAGLTLVVGDAYESAAAEREMLDRQLHLVDGLVITSSRLSDTDLRGLARIKPVVVLNRQVRGLPCFVPDNTRGVKRAAEHLGELGHTSIVYVAGPEASWADGMRWRALREAAFELGLAAQRIGPVAPTVRGGMAAALDIARGDHTAVQTYNDLVGVGVLKGLRAAGVDVPGQVSVVGFDDTLPADLVVPGLTTVASPSVLLGRSGVQTLVAMRQGAQPRTDQATVLPVHLVVRESTGPART
ncbi:LacI family DNA-binding transcriptional regulator [Nostocoides sp. F2B08]|uniref:LacI family DNA-binding transcriptional regulator n=1 Tax=Nostocoides sp. F2B08 TaxID=2653936 RepID=UPI001262E16A|nr:LacI family DNA-binding transcriptional regulator [Tetrasphaera sp. F2B08]KAB7744241.1 LacI family DNA-binding transcriptional regulator [Tetrasphaera sp. F2B08]